MKYAVSHRTVYEYSDDVRNSLGLAHVAPRPVAWQQIASHTVTIDPEPNDISHERDAFGNVVTYFHVTVPHTRLVVDARTDVTVEAPAMTVRRWRCPGSNRVRCSILMRPAPGPPRSSLWSPRRLSTSPTPTRMPRHP